MFTDRLSRIALFVIALSTTVIALRPLLAPPPVRAQVPGAYDVYIEPGIQTIRMPDGSGEVMGKMVVDLRTGNIYGFPTGAKAPYPIKLGATKPPVTEPVLLGRFDFGAIPSYLP